MRELAADLGAVKQRMEQRRARGGPRYGRLLPVAAVILAAAAGVWMLTSREQPPDVAPNLVPLTSFSGLKDYPSLSPDGRTLAFSWNGGQGGNGGRLERDIYVKPIGAGEPVRLTNSDQDNLWPVWSPDGRNLAFGRQGRGPQRTFYVIPAAGGPERRIAEGGNGVSWSPAGNALVLPRMPAPAGSGGLFLVDLSTGSQRELTAPKSEYDSLPAWSPDGRWIAFTRGAAEHQRGIWLVPAPGGTAKALKFGEKRILGLAWTANSREIVFSTQRDGAGEALWRLALTGGAPRRVDIASDGASSPNIPAIGGRLAYTSAFIDSNIYRAVRLGGEASPARWQYGREESIIASSREDHSPAISPDGNRVAFVSTRSGGQEIWLARPDGGGVSQLTFLKGSSVGSPRWSPDGRSIAFDVHRDGNTDVYVMGAGGDAPHRLTTDPAGDILPSWSIDGRWVYFNSDRSGTPQLWKVPAAGGAAVQITKGGARESWAAPDGSLIYFTRSRPEAAIWCVPPDGGPEQPVPELKNFDRISRSWGVTGEGLYFISRGDGPSQQIRFFQFATRRVTVLATLEKEPIWSVPAVALSADGRNLLIVHVDHEVNDLMLVENFH